MSNLRAKISKAISKKVPILALVVVAMFGMVAGVLAANLTVTPTNNTGEVGTYHTSTGSMTVTDNGLGVVANTASAVASATFPTSGNNNNANNALTAGHWFDQITFTDTLTDSKDLHEPCWSLRPSPLRVLVLRAPAPSPHMSILAQHR